jgi:hypothetical protein
MRLSVIAAAIFQLAFLLHNPAFACDPAENCGDTCVFGVCTKDYACEARKAACHVPVVGPALSSIPGSPTAPGGLLAPGGPGLAVISGNDLRRCLGDLSKCPSIAVAGYAYSAIAPVAEQYIQYLEGQGDGKWKTIPEDIIGRIQQYYPEIDLHSIRYAEQINTIHGFDITIGNDIFFVQPQNFNTFYGYGKLAHELQHSVQYQKKGGVDAFLAEYIAKSGGAIVANRSFNVHDDIDLEQEAIAKSTAVQQASNWYPLPNGFYRYDPSGAVAVSLHEKIPMFNVDGLPSQWVALQDVGSTRTFFRNGDGNCSPARLAGSSGARDWFFLEG